MSFWEFCEDLNKCGNSIDTIGKQINKIFELYYLNYDIEFVNNYLKQFRKTKDVNVS